MNETQLDLNLLHVFATVVQQSSFTKAARKLGVGKATVSRSIARLEELVGAELVHRTTHKVALSTAGTELYDRTAAHLSALDAAVRGLPEAAEQPSGELRITAPHDFGTIVLPSLLARFAVRYPDIRFDVSLTNAIVDLVADGFDLAIRFSGVLQDSNLTARRVGNLEVGFFAAPTYLARHGRPRALGEEPHDWVLPRASITRLGMAREPRCRFRCDDFFFLRDLLREGAGVGMLPSFLAEAYVRDGLLERVELTGFEPTSGGGFFLVYPSSGQVPRKVTAFRDFLIEEIERTSLA